MSRDLEPLILAARQGDRKALNDLAACADRFVRIFSGSLSRHLRKTQGSTIDFVLEGLAEAMAELEGFDYQSDGQFYGWVARVIRSRMIDAWRREDRQKRAGRPAPFAEGFEPDGREPTASRVVSDGELRSEVGRTIIELQLEHPQEMEAVVLKIFDGQSWPMIRELMDLTSDRVARTLFAKSIDLLRPRLREVLGDDTLNQILSDVFGLGAMLYTMLTGENLYAADSVDELLRRARHGDFVAPRERVPGREIPQALSAHPEERFQSAREFHDGLQSYIEGIHKEERRAEEAARLLDVAREVESGLAQAESRQAKLEEREGTLRAAVPDHAAADEKHVLWELIEELRVASEASTRMFNETTSSYEAVLSTDPTNGEARSALAELYFKRLEAVEDRDDTEAAGLYRAMVERYHDGSFDSRLRGQREVRFDSDPAGHWAGSRRVLFL